MAEQAIAQRLPRDTQIDFAGALDRPPRIYLRMTIQTQGHVQALRETCDVLKKLLEIYNEDAPRAPKAAAGQDEVAQSGQVQGESQPSGGANGEHPEQESPVIG